MPSSMEEFYEDLKKVKDGKLAVFLGAGASYDYGIPTMKEMAQMLIDDIAEGKQAKWVKEDVAEVMLAILGTTKEGLKTGEIEWNIEELLTRVNQISEAITKDPKFSRVKSEIDGLELTKEKIEELEHQLLGFMIQCFDVDSYKMTTRERKGNPEYIADFIKILGGFQSSIRIFTTNADLCVEIGLVRVSQEESLGGSKRFHLVDGFSNGLIPTFSIENFAQSTGMASNRIPVYLWKLHGSIDWVYTSPFGKKLDENATYNDESIICRRIAKERWTALFEAKAVTSNVMGDSSKIMVFPTPAKYSQTYTSPYMDLYESFRGTLEKIEFLIVVGTTFPDRHINSAIKAFLRRSNTHMYVIDPQLSEDMIRQVLGDYPTVKPVVKSGFSDFVDALKKLESQEISE